MIYKNEKLSKYSWFNLGGPAKVFFKARSLIDLKNFLIKNYNTANKIYVLGAGSNTLFRDSGFDKNIRFFSSRRDRVTLTGASISDSL